MNPAKQTQGWTKSVLGGQALGFRSKALVSRAVTVFVPALHYATPECAMVDMHRLKGPGKFRQFYGVQESARTESDVDCEMGLPSCDPSQDLWQGTVKLELKASASPVP